MPGRARRARERGPAGTVDRALRDRKRGVTGAGPDRASAVPRVAPAARGARSCAPMPQRILVVRVGRAGDLVMIKPAVRMILDAIPEGELKLLGRWEGSRVVGGFDHRMSRV